MRILQVNKFHYPRGGADKYFLDLSARLQAAGEEVAVFSMEHPKNLPSPWSRYFISRVSFSSKSLLNAIKIPSRVLYSLEAKRKFARLVEDFKPDIIHLHNIYHHISPSILDVAHKYRVPVVMHLHDYKLICPNYSLFTAGAQCSACCPHRYYQCLLKRCIKGSLAASALAVLEMYLHHNILKIYEKNIARLIAPSLFMKEMMLKFGWPDEKVAVIYNPYTPGLSGGETAVSAPVEQYVLYFGRLSAEKGLPVLIRAAALSGKKVKIAGVGPEEEKLKDLVLEIKADVEFVGFQEQAGLRVLINQAQAVVIPSIWPENMPLSLLEAMDCGKVVIASRIGGMPEIIHDKENGFLFPAGDASALAHILRNLDSLNLQTIGAAARTAVAQFSPERNLKEVLAVYREIKR